MNDAKPIPYWRLLAGVNRTQSWRRLKSTVAHSRLHAFLMGLFVLSYALLAYALFHKALQAPRGRREALPMARPSDTFRCESMFYVGIRPVS